MLTSKEAGVSTVRYACMRVCVDEVMLWQAWLRGLSLVGGAQAWRQKADLKQGVEYVVATPGRMIDMIKTGACSMRRCSYARCVCLRVIVLSCSS
jgi:superfamily II DNA/RNA helicase